MAKKRRIEKLRARKIKKHILKEELWTLDQITQVTPMIIFISHTLNFSFKPPTIVTSFLKSG